MSWRDELMKPIAVSDRWGESWEIYMVKAEALDFERWGRGYEWTWVALSPGTRPTREAFRDAMKRARTVTLTYPTPHAAHLEGNLGHFYWNGRGPSADRPYAEQPFVAGSTSWREIRGATVVMADDLIAEDDDGRRSFAPGVVR